MVLYSLPRLRWWIFGAYLLLQDWLLDAPRLRIGCCRLLIPTHSLPALSKSFGKLSWAPDSRSNEWSEEWNLNVFLILKVFKCFIKEFPNSFQTSKKLLKELITPVANHWITKLSVQGTVLVYLKNECIKWPWQVINNKDKSKRLNL